MSAVSYGENLAVGDDSDFVSKGFDQFRDGYGHQHSGFITVGQLFENLTKRVQSRRVQAPGERLVKYHNRGFTDQSGADTDFLSLSGGVKVDRCVAVVREVKQTQKLIDMIHQVEFFHIVDPSYGKKKLAAGDTQGKEGLVRKIENFLANFDFGLDAAAPAFAVDLDIALDRAGTPAITLSRVVLPIPLGPMTATNSPAATCSKTSFKIGRIP